MFRGRRSGRFPGRIAASEAVAVVQKVYLSSAMDGSMQDLKPSAGDEDGAATDRSWPAPRELLTIFTAGWLGGAGLLTLFAPVSLPVRLLSFAEAVAAALWFVPRLRMAGFGAMLAVLAVAALRDLATGEHPGSVIFYAAVVTYLVIEERRSGRAE